MYVYIRMHMHGILQFWEKADVKTCQKYINHLQKVLPQMIEAQGDATGF